MLRDDNEPSMDKMDDYNGKESTEKRKLINNVILGLIFMGFVLAVLKFAGDGSDDYIGTAQNPGINTAKGNF